jgi:hypothetical protein
LPADDLAVLLHERDPFTSELWADRGG